MKKRPWRYAALVSARNLQGLLFFFLVWGDADGDGMVRVIRGVILYFGEKMTMVRWDKRLLEEFTHSAVSNNF